MHICVENVGHNGHHYKLFFCFYISKDFILNCLLILFTLHANILLGNTKVNSEYSCHMIRVVPCGGWNLVNLVTLLGYLSGVFFCKAT